jgi:hypothetical protein
MITETSEQIAFVEYCDLIKIPVVHIPNESKRSKTYGAQLKRMGMRSGFPDLFIPVACRGYFGLFIEMKSDKGTLRPEQREWLDTLTKHGYLCRVCRSFESAKQTLDAYLGG